MMKTLLILIGMIGLGFTSCDSADKKVDLTGMKWVLQTLDGKKVDLQEERSQVYIQFNATDKRAIGMAGCNRFFGGYELDGTKLKFSQMGATRMACPDMQVESAFFKVLESTDSCGIKEHTLTLFSKGKALAVFKGEPLTEEKE